jgi:hypothetical protein
MNAIWQQIGAATRILRLSYPIRRLAQDHAVEAKIGFVEALDDIQKAVARELDDTGCPEHS